MIASHTKRDGVYEPVFRVFTLDTQLLSRDACACARGADGKRALHDYYVSTPLATVRNAPRQHRPHPLSMC